MPIARDARNNRRRRVLRDQAEETLTQRKGRKTRQTEEPDETDEKSARRSAGYSQEVRRACGARLVQLIPVRKSSYTALVIVSLLIPSVLLLAHYMIYVSGSLVWYGHPLATMLDASHPRSIASWLGSNIWLLCLGVTLLTFQLRKHKLDDYDGEYRLWFWMVLTCVLASMDATTRFTELLGLALNSWSQQTLGWSGPAVVTATLATLVGLLGLRLCTELKTVPTSLVFWLVGLVSWAGSAALAQEELRLEISLQLRIWLKVSLWLGGLTAIWLSAVTYLRSVYIEAQQRFLARRKLAQKPTLSFRERFKASIPSFSRVATDAESDAIDEEESKRSRWRLPSLRRSKEAEETAATEEDAHKETAREKRRREREELAELRKLEKEEKDLERQAAREKKSQRQAVASQPARSEPAEESPAQDSETTRTGWRKLIPVGLGRKRSAESEDEAEVDKTPSRPVKDAAAEGEGESKRSKWTSWIRAPKVGEDAEEYHKVPRGQRRNSKESKNDESTEEADAAPKTRRSWFGMKKPDNGEEGLAQTENDSGEAKPRKKGFFSRFTLQPPEEGTDTAESSAAPDGTPDFQPQEDSTPARSTADASFDEPERPNRPLSKAERKRLRRQQKNRAA